MVYLHSCTDTGYWIQDTGYRIQDTGYRIQDTEHRIQDTGYRIQDAELRDTEYRMQKDKYKYMGRNIALCSDCNEPIPRQDLEKHRYSNHKQVKLNKRNSVFATNSDFQSL